MKIAGLDAAVADDRRGLTLTDAAGRRVATVWFAVPGEVVEGWEADDGEWLLTRAGGVQVRLRADWSPDAVTLHLTVDNQTAEPVELPYLGLGVRVGSGTVGWSWASDLDGIITLVSGVSGEGGVRLRLQRGFLRAAGELPVYADESTEEALPGLALADGGQGAFHLGPPAGRLGAFRRHEVVLDLAPLGRLEDASVLLPPWLPPAVAEADEDLAISLPDEAVVPGSQVEDETEDDTVHLVGRPGHREVRVHGPRGVRRVRLAWCPTRAQLLTALGESLPRRRPQRASDAAGVVVVEALRRGFVADADRALDWLDQVDWLDRDTLLADAAAGLLAATQRERRQVDAAWDFLGRRAIQPGYGLAVMQLWQATLGQDPDRTEAAHELLARPAPDPASGLELALLGYRSAEALGPALAGLVNLLGGPLPGRPLALAASRAAIAASLLKLCPEGWPIAPDAAAAAWKTDALLRADYAPAVTGEDPLHADLDGLAWLLLGDLGQ